MRQHFRWLSLSLWQCLFIILSFSTVIEILTLIWEPGKQKSSGLRCVWGKDHWHAPRADKERQMLWRLQVESVWLSMKSRKPWISHNTYCRWMCREETVYSNQCHGIWITTLRPFQTFPVAFFLSTQHKFYFDQVFGEKSSNEEVYHQTAYPLVQHMLKG